MRGIILRLLRKVYLYPLLFLYNFNKKEDITVVMGVKNIFDCERIVNSLESIRNQEYDQSLVRINLVDYDSDSSLIQYYQQICKVYNVLYTRVNGKAIWSRAHALNIGIRNAKTKYILCTDADIIFERNYIKEAIKELKKDPLQVIIAPAFDLPDIPTRGKECVQLKSLAQIRYKDIKNWAGINLALTYFYHKIRGYVEQYKMWGSEDEDLIKRLKLFALKNKPIENSTFFLHQYHPKFRNVDRLNGFRAQVIINRVYCRRSSSIIRNGKQWGSSE